MQLCKLCGNEISDTTSTCPYCGHTCQIVYKNKAEIVRTINIELNMPTVAEALFLLNKELDKSRAYRTVLLKIIHGYGSSGIGGELRIAIRQTLSGMKKHGQIRDFVPGECVIEHLEKIQKLRHALPQLKKDAELNNPNPGITLVILR